MKGWNQEEKHRDCTWHDKTQPTPAPEVYTKSIFQEKPYRTLCPDPPQGSKASFPQRRTSPLPSSHLRCRSTRKLVPRTEAWDGV